ncbi:hypothetical protein E5288_WYG014215 [Bos mutus]|uniref:dAMP1 SANT/Myb-like domain-containing protein n=1 Tax=Bos mutus TaxID=72004 RepID=A0A6B0R5L2_9CETA|nr:hypothetical protein [Bos mutus]
MPSTNPACKDGARSSTGDRQLRRARLSPCPRSIRLLVPVHSEQEYQLWLHQDTQTEAETGHLFDLSRCFGLPFVIRHAWDDRQQLTEPPVEDLKERYYRV